MPHSDDALAVMAVQNAYAEAIDSRDWSALRACFAPDAAIGFGRPARVGSLAEFLAWAPEFHEALGPTLHQVTTHQAQVQGQGATASAYLHAVLVDADGASALTILGRYDDELVRGDERGWLIRRRRFTPTWRFRTASSDTAPSQGAAS